MVFSGFALKNRVIAFFRVSLRRRGVPSEEVPTRRIPAHSLTSLTRA